MREVGSDIWKPGDRLDCCICHETVLIGIFFSGGGERVSRVVSKGRVSSSPVFLNRFLQVGKGALRAVFVCSLNDSVTDHVPRIERRPYGPKTKILPVNLFSEEEVWVIWFGSFWIGFVVTEKSCQHDADHQR